MDGSFLSCVSTSWANKFKLKKTRLGLMWLMENKLHISLKDRKSLKVFLKVTASLVPQYTASPWGDPWSHWGRIEVYLVLCAEGWVTVRCTILWETRRQVFSSQEHLWCPPNCHRKLQIFWANSTHSNRHSIKVTCAEIIRNKKKSSHTLLKNKK